jgi:dienelactone hydrolase
VTELKRRVRGKGLTAVGFCFGGGMVWRLLAAGERRLAAAFCGPFLEGGNLEGSRAAVLGVYGGLDARVNATRPAAKAALGAAGLKYELVTFAEADHAFFNLTVEVLFRSESGGDGCLCTGVGEASVEGDLEGVEGRLPAVGPALPATAGGVEGDDGEVEDLHRGCSLGK